MKDSNMTVGFLVQEPNLLKKSYLKTRNLDSIYWDTNFI